MSEIDIGGIENFHAPFQGKPQPCKEAPLILFVLAICAFAIGTTEFVIAGLLNVMATDLNVSIPTAGWVMTSYALGVTAGAPIITAFTIHMRRKYVLTSLLALFVLGNVISALAGTFSLLIVGRVLAALCHGSFFGISAVIASHIVEPSKRSMAVALMFSGLTLANVLGVPLGTLMGEHWGWHAPFYAISAIGIIGLIGIVFFIPYQLALPPTHLSKEFSALMRPDIGLAFLVTALGFGGLFASFSYIAPLLINVTQFTQSEVAYLLILFGVGLMIGNFLGGKATDKSLKGTLYASLFFLALTLFILVWTAEAKWPAVITLFILGIIGFGTVPPLQMQVVHRAKTAPTLSSSTNVAAFNLGISLSVYLGGLGISLGWGYTSPSWIGSILTFTALLIAIFLNNKYKE
ncbi:MAG: MFS transporter [Verrucomicrobia bacterium]|nr:MFS transporter [Verrucomicrobiota bacterium]